jgi:hypothetical protein
VLDQARRRFLLVGQQQDLPQVCLIQLRIQIISQRNVHDTPGKPPTGKRQLWQEGQVGLASLPSTTRRTLQPLLRRRLEHSKIPTSGLFDSTTDTDNFQRNMLDTTRTTPAVNHQLWQEGQALTKSSFNDPSDVAFE